MGRFIGFFTNIYNNISLVPTVIYNSIWGYLFWCLVKSSLDRTNLECQILTDWNYIGLYICLFSLIKGICLVSFIKVELDNSNHQFFLLFFKIFSGVIISSFIGYKFYVKSRIKFEETYCKDIQTYHYFFSMFELTYAIFFYTFCCCIFINALTKKDDCNIGDIDKEY